VAWTGETCEERTDVHHDGVKDYPAFQELDIPVRLLAAAVKELEGPYPGRTAHVDLSSRLGIEGPDIPPFGRIVPAALWVAFSSDLGCGQLEWRGWDMVVGHLWSGESRRGRTRLEPIKSNSQITKMDPITMAGAVGSYARVPMQGL
jgi:hypothetical protein